MPSSGGKPRLQTVNRLLEYAGEPASRHRVSDVRIGLGYTAVMLDDGSTGVALTFSDQAAGGCSVFRGMRPLAGIEASVLLDLLPSEDKIEAAVGLACVNALVNRPSDRYIQGDVLEYLGIGSADRVGMVGNFGPLIGAVRAKAASLDVFERVKKPQGYLRPAEDAYEVLGQCQVAMITGTTIINHTVDGLLDAAAGCREVALLGASTPMLPEAFAGRKIDLLSGIVIHDPDGILQIVSEGGGMHFFKPCIHKVNLKSGRSS